MARTKARRQKTHKKTARRVGHVPANLANRIESLARNFWWTWDNPTQRLFAGLSPTLWEAHQHNPLAVVAALPTERVTALEQNPAFLKELADCERRLDQYLRQRTWFARHATRSQRDATIAYFCAEFALHESFPQYSGGLGVLAGDHLKSASDLGIPLVGVGLLYRVGYYQQEFDPTGATVPVYPEYDFSQFPVTDTGVRVEIPLGRRTIEAAVWQLQVGRVSLYLLDTDVPGNQPQDRAITRQLYGGDNETRIRQEIVLGIGGVRALSELGIQPTVFHLNEGHAAFCALARVRDYIEQGDTYEEAAAAVRDTTVFTTHTPVPAGHDRFDRKLTMKYLKPLADALGLARRDFLDLGRENPGAQDDTFCMTVLALNLSTHRNGVSEIHGQVSREMWVHVHPDAKKPADVPIGFVTNGVHTQTWLAPEMCPLIQQYLNPDWQDPDKLAAAFKRAKRIPDAELWALRNTLRAKLVQFIRERLREQILARAGDVDMLTASYATFREDALTIGFARRFATYKRAPLIFRDAKRLQKILSHPQRPVQLVFAGKAHPADKDGQAFAQEIFEYSRQEGFIGRVVLLENYDMHIGRLLTCGCDVWLNNPMPPREASGTSGMKPPLHGGLNCSILDGWWPECYDEKNGWSIDPPKAGRTQRTRDKADAEEIYRLLEKEIIPAFYTRTRQGLPKQWTRMMKHSLQTVPQTYNTHRMLNEYWDHYYAPAHALAW